IVVLTTSAIDAPAAPSTAARLTSVWSVWASMPSGIVPVAGSIPAMPEQKTKPPATIAWLYGPSAAGASSLDTASLVIGRLLCWMASQRSRGPIRPGTRAGLHELRNRRAAARDTRHSLALCARSGVQDQRFIASAP